MSAPAAAATRATTTTPKVKPRRPKVEHLYWVGERAVAQQLGVSEVPSLCGRKWIAYGLEELVNVARVHGQAVVVNPATRDCKLCLAVYRRTLESRWHG